jgi:hypothetical protein
MVPRFCLGGHRGGVQMEKWRPLSIRGTQARSPTSRSAVPRRRPIRRAHSPADDEWHDARRRARTARDVPVLRRRLRLADVPRPAPRDRMLLGLDRVRHSRSRTVAAQPEKPSAGQGLFAVRLTLIQEIRAIARPRMRYSVRLAALAAELRRGARHRNCAVPNASGAPSSGKRRGRRSAGDRRIPPAPHQAAPLPGDNRPSRGGA